MAYEGWDEDGPAGLGLARAYRLRLEASPEAHHLYAAPDILPHPVELRLDGRGLEPVTIQSIQVVGDGFVLDGPEAPLELAPASETSWTISFIAEEPGAYPAEVLVASDDPDHPVRRLDLIGRFGQGTHCDQTGVTLAMPRTLYQSGSEMYLDAFVCNAGAAPLEDHALLVALELNGEFWLAPDWMMLEGDPGFLQGDIPPGSWRVEVIPPLRWPKKVGSSSAAFWGALLAPDLTTPVGAIDRWEFRWK